MIAATCLAVLACNKGTETPDGSGKRIAIQAGIGDLTKVATTGNTATFESGDQISLFAWTGSEAAVPASLLVDGVKNTLEADGKWVPEKQMLWADMVSPHYFIGIHPARSVSDFTADAYTLDPADYKGSDLLVATNVSGLKAQDNPVVLAFDHVMAKLVVNLTFRNQWATAPTVTAVEATAKKTASVDYLSKTVTATGAAGAVALTAGANDVWSSLQVPQTGMNTLTIKIDGKNYVYTHTADIPLVGGKYTTVNLTVGRDKIELSDAVTISAWTSQGDVITGDAEEDLYNGHAYVDMGNGLKWATCNVGASKPEDYGDYIAWGETEPREKYSWGTYQWMQAEKSDWPYITRYTFADGKTSGIWYDGETFIGDGKTSFADYDYADDAARANWGAYWRTPTNDEWTWLRNNANCTWEWQDDYNGTKGMLVTSKVNGNQIFLPAAGYRDNDSLINAGVYGFYWSSSLFNISSAFATYVIFSSDSLYMDFDRRYYGQAVRPVTQY